MRHSKLLYIAVISLLLPAVSGAQDADHAIQSANIELTKAKSLWFNTGNAAGLSLTPLQNFNEVSAGYDHKSGNFTYAQNGRENNAVVNTNGALDLGGVMLWGNFTYKNINTSDACYNTLLGNPLRDMPYTLADTVQSSWKKQEYMLNMKAGFPVLWNLLRFGCEIDYVTSTAAKQNDPRSTDYYMTVAVRPGMAFRVNDNHNIGLNFIYENSYERTSPTNSDDQNNQLVYLMRGLGNCINEIVGGLGGVGTFFYKGNVVGGAAQYSYDSGKAFSLLADFKYTFRVEDAFQSPSKPESMGTIKQNVYNGNIQLLLERPRLTHKAVLNYLNKISDGIEYIQVVDNTYEVQEWVTLAQYIRSSYTYESFGLDYDLFVNAARGYSWRVGAKVLYSDRYDEYYLPHSDLKAENVYFELNAKKNFAVSRKSSLLAGVGAGYNSNIDGYYNYTGSSANTPIVKKMFYNDIAFLSSDYYQLRAEAKFSTLVTSRTSLFVGANVQYAKPDNEMFDHRVGAFCSFGINF